MSDFRIPHRRLLLEGTVIVGSILLAFAIDAWWENRQEREREAEALEVLVRDLEGTEAQLAEFDLFARDKSAAAFEAGRRLGVAVPREEEDEVVELILRATTRRTVALPRSGYTDLVSSGSLRVIRDPEIRDHILRFYQQAERMEEIVEKNSTQGTDEGLSPALIPTGLLLPRPPKIALNDIFAEAIERIEEQVGPDMVYPRDRLWNHGPESQEWAGIRALLYRVGSLETINSVLVNRTAGAAQTLRLELLAYLDELGRPITPSGDGNSP